MPLDESSAPTQPITPWPEIDRSLIAETRPPPVPFPMLVLPDRWRTWIEARRTPSRPSTTWRRACCRRSPGCAAAASWRA